MRQRAEDLRRGIRAAAVTMATPRTTIVAAALNGLQARSPEPMPHSRESIMSCTPCATSPSIRMRPPRTPGSSSAAEASLAAPAAGAPALADLPRVAMPDVPALSKSALCIDRAMGWVGFEHPQPPSGNPDGAPACGAKCGAVSSDSAGRRTSAAIADADLAVVVEAWSTLPAPLKAGILAIVRASE